MKKSASGAGAMRISPSAPTPLRRSHSAAIVSRFRRIRSATSSIITKSFPVPWYLENCICLLLDLRGRNRPDRRLCLIPSKIRPDLLHHLERAFLARSEPPDAGVASKPCHLPARQRLRPAGRRGYRLALANHALETGGRFSVADGLTGGQEGAEPPFPGIPAHRRPLGSTGRRSRRAGRAYLSIGCQPSPPEPDAGIGPPRTAPPDPPDRRGDAELVGAAPQWAWPSRSPSRDRQASNRRTRSPPRAPPRQGSTPRSSPTPSAPPVQ